MSELVNLEKRFENALEKLERALANNKMDKATENFNKKEELNKDINHNIDDLPDSIEKLYFTRSTHFNHPINKLPKNLKYINLGRFTIRSFNNIIPNRNIFDFSLS